MRGNICLMDDTKGNQQQQICKCTRARCTAAGMYGMRHKWMTDLYSFRLGGQADHQRWWYMKQMLGDPLHRRVRYCDSLWSHSCHEKKQELRVKRRESDTGTNISSPRDSYWSLRGMHAWLASHMNLPQINTSKTNNFGHVWMIDVSVSVSGSF
jgi:hypothetical protein